MNNTHHDHQPRQRFIHFIAVIIVFLIIVAGVVSVWMAIQPAVHVPTPPIQLT